MLKIDSIDVFYDKIQVLRQVSLEVKEKETVTIIGANGAGKTTLLKTVMGLLKPARGKIELFGEPLHGLDPWLIVQRGISLVPEGRQVFPEMSVLENLYMGSYARKDKDGIQNDLENVFRLFPKLKGRSQQMAGTLSGGEQQMLAIGRALMSKPKLLLLDEPSMGLAPIIVEEIFDIIRDITSAGTTVLLVEQNARLALSIANRGYVLETGKIIMEDKAELLLNNRQVKEAYLGI
ncbi:MAG: ABC transporter ATP-binding protein [Peptococcaceae bacterium]|nr:ABC transporter ATP-binding protein [Peptococcaceae bacterium]MDH7524830.1 ABC transporter ATP-binding protein [Peptococcaceae bacterium]